MSIEIKEVMNKKDVKTFVKIPFKIFEGNKYWVPPLIMDEIETFDRKKNPALENSEIRMFIAYKNNEPVGRICAINNKVANKKYNTKNLRFGWFDTIDDYEVAKALFEKTEEWARELGMETITGPHGFTDLDPEGMLIEGFDQLPTIAVYYNHPYYPEFTEKYGFEKEIDYIEFKTPVPHETGIPEKLLRIAEKVKERSNLRVLKFRNKKHLMQRAGEIFHLLDESFEEIYGSVPLTEKQVNFYVKQYFPFVDVDFIKVVVNEKDEIVGFMITVPSLSKAFQKAKGRLFPFGWYAILKALKNHEILDFYLAGVKPSYRGQGVDLLMVIDIVKTALEKGFQYAESNPELENNKKIHAQWKYFNPKQHKRRRIFKKTLK